MYVMYVQFFFLLRQLFAEPCNLISYTNLISWDGSLTQDLFLKVVKFNLLNIVIYIISFRNAECSNAGRRGEAY